MVRDKTNYQREQIVGGWLYWIKYGVQRKVINIQKMTIMQNPIKSGLMWCYFS